jgi:hypothetical protein
MLLGARAHAAPPKLSIYVRNVRGFSTAAVCAKKNEQMPPRPTLPDEELTYRALKGSGPGGQKIVSDILREQLVHRTDGHL